MAEQSYNASDLNSVLQTLSSLTAQPSHPQNVPVGSEQPSAMAQRLYGESQTPRQPPPSPPKQSSTPTLDPATITSWPAALRYVMRTVGQNEETQLRIRGLIRSQHSHEQQWWKGREALLQRQQARGDKKKELDAVLRSIGAPVDSKEISSLGEDRAELANYDAKVYKASVQMADALIAELRGLKIPFFVLNQRLIQDASTSPPGTTVPSQDQSIIGATSSKLTKHEVAGLQRRMLELLQDLCKE
ncbi:uncharacterized protein N7459_006841 [Penicillium hispanicum]|uniref:uncharacterized protein n=1 Tax=Penicillium hispanicum TaxID=1080232 RepID=UPI0025413BB0|nr:uncharacterized protein N7459_006841 [Penicillium hispanicum]KAJ5577877.1 hypothetical protein N7459_006841 [Penicillium hispanicum]